MPKKSNRTKPTRQPSRLRRFVSRHQVLSAIVIIIAVFAVLISTLFAVIAYNRTQERLHFKQIKGDLLTLQQRLNAADSGGWEYRQACTRTGGGFQTTITSCGLGVSKKYTEVDQQKIDAVVKKTNNTLDSVSKDLFKPHDGSFTMLPPRLAEIQFPGSDDIVNEGSTGSGIKIDSVRFGNAVDCGFQYNLSAAKPGPARFGTLDIDLDCSEHTHETYFNRIDVDPQFSDHKAEYPL